MAIDESYRLRFVLESDATFGRGDGIAGLVDREVEHEQGLPYLKGRTLKDLLAEECKNILFSLSLSRKHDMAPLYEAADRLFGQPGSHEDDESILYVDNARLPDNLRQAVLLAVADSTNKLSPNDVLESLTDIRRQTAIESTTGAPATATLRAMRVIIRGLPFEAELTFKEPARNLELGLLGACALAFRRAGTSRNRGRGRLSASILDNNGMDKTKDFFEIFKKAVEES